MNKELEIPGVDQNIMNEDDNAADEEDNVEQKRVRFEKDQAEMEERYGKRNGNHNLRIRKPVDYSHLHANATLEQIALTRYTIKKGLKAFGEPGADAVVKEMKQLHDREVIEPKAAHMMTPTEKRKALEYLMFLKKRGGIIKARGCADGRKQ